MPDDVGLPDVSSTIIEEQKVLDGHPFPLVLTPTVSGKDATAWCSWLKENVDRVKQLLVDRGAILFRGFPISSPADFDQFTKNLGWDEFPYVGGVSVRRPVVGNVYTSTESPPECRIPFHHEMAHVADHPKILCAYCDVEPPEGGQTPLAVSHVVYRLMAEREPEFVSRLADEGVRYIRVAPDGDDVNSALGRSWQSTFFAEDRETAEENARKAGFEFAWMPDGSMKYISAPLPAIRVDQRTGKKTWFNSVNTCYFAWQDARNERTRAVLFPDGDQMPAEAMNNLHQVLTEEASVSVRWRRGDVVIVDNLQVMHARNHFTPPRRVLVSLFKY